MPNKLPLYTRPGRGKPSFAYLHKSAQKLIPQLAWANPKTDADFRAITPPGFARAFYEVNKEGEGDCGITMTVHGEGEADTILKLIRKWNTRPALLTPEQIKRLEELE